MKDIFDTLKNAALAAWAVIWPKLKAMLVRIWNWSLGAYWDGAMVLVRAPKTFVLVGTLALGSMVWGHHAATSKDSVIIANVKQQGAAAVLAAAAAADEKIKVLEAKVKELTPPPAQPTPAKRTATAKKAKTG